MEYNVTAVPARKVAGFHLVGPWEKTVPQGFEQLLMWVEAHHLRPDEWIAVYYDNPDCTPPEKLRAATVVTVPEGFAIPENSVGVIHTEITGGQYAVASARVQDGDFGKPWLLFFNSLLEDASVMPAPLPCFEIYLNDGKTDGFWDIEMHIPVTDKVD
ncbi:DNA gyrase inhibitor SbmC [Siccibacter colletis]|uniref:DNA gyrase inhibitor SbmC n=1 Tax=Siccibacter colletis TaxID=1505757 RepID=UPI003CEBF766